MNTRDAELIVNFVRGLLTSETPAAAENSVKDFLRAAEGTPGTGICICMIPPEYLHKMAREWHDKFETVNLKMCLDHRCPEHGEKAQPALWGRHKDMELSVTAQQWLSLGVTRS